MLPTFQLFRSAYGPLYNEKNVPQLQSVPRAALPVRAQRAASVMDILDMPLMGELPIACASLHLDGYA